MDFSRPKVMGIINVTPDSFYSQSRTFSQDAIARRLDGMLAEEADIIDIGGYSTRPRGHPGRPGEEKLPPPPPASFWAITPTGAAGWGWPGPCSA